MGLNFGTLGVMSKIKSGVPKFRKNPFKLKKNYKNLYRTTKRESRFY